MSPGRVYTPAQRRALRPRRFLGEVEVAEDGDVADSEGGGAADSEGEEEQQASPSARWVVWRSGPWARLSIAYWPSSPLF